MSMLLLIKNCIEVIITIQYYLKFSFIILAVSQIAIVLLKRYLETHFMKNINVSHNKCLFFLLYTPTTFVSHKKKSHLFFS